MFSAPCPPSFKCLTKIIMKYCYFSTFTSKTLQYNESITKSNVDGRDNSQPVLMTEHTTCFACIICTLLLLFSLLFINLCWFWPLYQYFFPSYPLNPILIRKNWEVHTHYTNHHCIQCTYGFYCMSHYPNDS